MNKYLISILVIGILSGLLGLFLNPYSFGISYYLGNLICWIIAHRSLRKDWIIIPLILASLQFVTFANYEKVIYSDSLLYHDYEYINGILFTMYFWQVNKSSNNLLTLIFSSIGIYLSINMLIKEVAGIITQPFIGEFVLVGYLMYDSINKIIKYRNERDNKKL